MLLVSSRSRVAGEADASADEAHRLGLGPGDRVLVIERVRTADGRPVVYPVVPGRPEVTSGANSLAKRSSRWSLATGMASMRGPSTGEPVPWDRRQLAGITTQLEQSNPRRLRLWIAQSGTPQADEQESFPSLPGPPSAEFAYSSGT